MQGSRDSESLGEGRGRAKGPQWTRTRQDSRQKAETNMVILHAAQCWERPRVHGKDGQTGQHPYCLALLQGVSRKHM